MLTSSISLGSFEIIVKTIYLIAEFEACKQFNQWQISVPGYARPLLKRIFLRHDNWDLPSNKMLSVFLFTKMKKR